MPTTEATPGLGNHSQPTSAELKNTRRSRQRIMTSLTLIFILLAFVWGVYYLTWGQFYEYTDDAYVSGNLVRLMPRTTGTVIAINTDDTQIVEAGQPLIKLDDIDAGNQLERAKAALASTVRKVRQYYDNVVLTQAALTLRQADLVNAKQELQRRQGLVRERAISKEELANYSTALASAQARYDSAKAQLDAATALVENTTLYSHPEVHRAVTALKTAALNLARTTIIAPVTGYVAKRNVQIGQEVTPGNSLMAIVPLREVWVDANYKESQLTRLRIGQDVALTADAFNGHVFHGKIQGLSAGTGSAFDLLPPQNATGNWIKIVQRVPVRIVLDANELKNYPLRIGLSVRVTTATSSLQGDILNQATGAHTYYATSVYQNELATVDQMVTTILHANSPNMKMLAANASGSAA